MISLLLVALIDPSAAQDELPAKVRAFQQKDDRDGCASLFLAHPAEVLPVIEGFLERALSLREGRRDEDVEPARAHEQLAVWSARVARDALGAPLVADLAASRAGWTESDRRLHSDARAVHARALGAIEKGENRLGLEAGLESTTRSLALGDWRGAAAGYQTAAIAHQALSSFDDALIAWNQARLVYRGLGARDEELSCQRAVVDMCHATGRFERGREAADQAVSLAASLGNKKIQAELLERRARCEEKLGLREEAAATRAAAKALGG